MTKLNTPKVARYVIVGALLGAVMTLAAPHAMVAQPSGTTTMKARHPGDASSPERNFLEENSFAMATMMRDMHAQPTGDIDRDFVHQMIPHHQGAIDMANALLKAGHNDRLKRLAQEIIITQQEEIAMMRLLVPEQESAESAKRPSVLRRTGTHHAMRMYASATVNRDPT